MTRTIAVLVALFLAVHVSVAGVAAPVPVLLGFGYVITGLSYLICRAGRLRLVWRTVPW